MSRWEKAQQGSRRSAQFVDAVYSLDCSRVRTTWSPASNRVEKIIITDLAAFKYDLKSVDILIAAASDTEGRAWLERPGEFQGVDAERMRNMSGRITANHRGAPNGPCSDYIAQDAP
jgi:hypothetical protein